MSDVDLLFMDDDEADGDLSAIDVVRRGIARTPTVKRTIAFSALISVTVAIGRLAIPVLVQQVIDRGLLGDEGYRSGLVAGLAAAALVVVVVVAVLTPIAEVAMIRGAQQSLYELRRQAFAHIHRLSLAEHSREKRGVLLARVTSDVETVSRFVEWGAVTWAMNVSVIVGAFVVMAVYSWQLTLVAIGTMATVVPAVRFIHGRQLRAYRRARTAVGDLLAVFNEAISGSDAIRSYGYQRAARSRIGSAIRARYRADMRTSKYTAVLFTVGDFIGAVTMVAVALVAVEWGPGWGLGAGEVISFFFLVTLVQSPIGEITEVLEQTQTAVAGWDKVLTLLDQEPEIQSPEEGPGLPVGPLSIEFDNVDAGYDDVQVLHGVSLAIPAGTRVAVVGETGSGKTTFARLLCRLMDPTAGTVRLGGVDVRELTTPGRRDAIRLVPQDGFLFDTRVLRNITYGRPGATEGDARRALDELGLGAWAAGLSDGHDTRVGPRGEHLSVGERQLVALARVQVADPGVLVLDEATSSVDPETEQALSEALRRVAAGRTVVSIAHRLSTAEQADLVLVFDDGRLVEQGRHGDLVASEGVYARLYRSWQRTVAER
ncbi:MAG: ABC transporter ATP-binding protein [Actinomycetota bacterium]